MDNCNSFLDKSSFNLWPGQMGLYQKEILTAISSLNDPINIVHLQLHSKHVLLLSICQALFFAIYTY